MSDAKSLLREFERTEYWLQGKVEYLFWGGQRLETWIHIEDDAQPTERQIRVFASLVKHSQDLRPYFEEELYRKYQNEIYGSMTSYSPERGCYGSDEITPPIQSSSEIWKLIGPPTVDIPGPYEEVPDCETWFKLHLSCCWDDEHGLQVEFRDYKIVYIGPQG